jgi:lysosomal acid lipase/cholesteryl ester hydrolase
LNVRGNSYSKNHNFLNAKSDTEFWDFSFEEMGDQDLPTLIDYVLQVTGKPKITLFAFSQGTTISFYSLVSNKERFKDKIKGFVAMAPVITLNNSTQSLLRSLSGNDMITYALEKSGFVEVFSEN